MVNSLWTGVGGAQFFGGLNLVTLFLLQVSTKGVKAPHNILIRLF